MHSHLGVLGVTGFLMKNLSANPLDYVEGGALNARARGALAHPRLDQSRPRAFQKRGGKMIVTIGTNDTLASPGAQLDYYQSVLDKMGRATVDRFARLFVMPQTGHGLSGTSYTVDGDGKTIPADADSESLRPAAAAVRLGREERGAADVGRRHRRRPESAALLVSVVSALCDRTDRELGVLSMYGIARTTRRHHVSTRRHHHDHHTHHQAYGPRSRRPCCWAPA